MLVWKNLLAKLVEASTLSRLFLQQLLATCSFQILWLHVFACDYS